MTARQGLQQYNKSFIWASVDLYDHNLGISGSGLYSEFFWGVPVLLLAKGLWSSPLLNNIYRYLMGPLRCTITSLGFTNCSPPLQFGTKSLKTCRGEEQIINPWLAKYYGCCCIIIYIFRALIFLKGVTLSVMLKEGRGTCIYRHKFILVWHTDPDF